MTTNGLFETLNAQAARYKVLLWLLGVAFVVFGFDFKTPATHFRAIEQSLLEVRQNELVLGRRIDTGDSTRIQMTFYLRALMIAQCIDRPAAQTQRMGLPCGDLLNPRAR